MAESQPELVVVPLPSSEHPGRCQVPTRYGAERPCLNPAEGVAADWTAPLDPSRAVGGCEGCARAYGLDFRPF